MISPPTIDPGTLPKPPTTAAGNAFRPMKPMLECTNVAGASRIPANAPTHAATPRRRPEDQIVDQPYRDSHVVRGELVLRSRLHRDADASETKEQIKRGAKPGSQDDHHQLLHRKNHAGDFPHVVDVRRRNLVGLGAPSR